MIDFGISKECSKTSAFTTSGKGTVSYQPPENVLTDIEHDVNSEDFFETNFNKERKVAKSFDIWALGLILNEIFGNESPWEELKGNPNKIIFELMKKKEFPISKSIRDNQIYHLVKHCTRIHPNDRINIKSLINEF